MKLKIKELTKENALEYIDQVAELEKVVLEAMEKEGKIGQLFITGKEDIMEYVKSDENMVVVAVDEGNKVQSATYITKGQKPFTYNDITKYFKVGPKYQEYVKTLYSSKEEYLKAMLETYKMKLAAYDIAEKRIIEQYPEYKNVQEFLDDELKANDFHEKSILREKWNEFMSEYIIEHGDQEKYEQFFWTTARDIAKEIGKDITKTNKSVENYEEWLSNQKGYEQILDKAALKIHEEPDFDISKYYTANTGNAIEIDTYLTDPNQRHSGIARIIVYEGIKKQIEEHFQKPENQDVFLCSTLHRENVSSKYVSEFFGLKDSLYVRRRQGRDREVHICKIEREQAKEYLSHKQDKLAILYGYNPENKKISDDKKMDIFQEQLDYEKQQFKRLNKARHYPCKYTGNVNDVRSKANRIVSLKSQIKELERRTYEEEI